MTTITVTVTVTSNQISQILRILGEKGPIHLSNEDVAIPSVCLNSGPSVAPSASVQQFRQLLRGSTEKLVRFVVTHGQEFLNDELAGELGFDNPAYTSSVLGKITGKLRRVGIRAEGHRKMNWYTTHKEKGKTLLRIRPDVFRFFAETID